MAPDGITAGVIERCFKRITQDDRHDYKVMSLTCSCLVFRPGCFLAVFSARRVVKKKTECKLNFRTTDISVRHFTESEIGKVSFFSHSHQAPIFPHLSPDPPARFRKEKKLFMTD